MPAEIESFFYLARKTSASEKPAFLSKQLRRCVRVSLFKKMKKVCRLRNSAIFRKKAEAA